jgi:alpha-galactosidase
MASSPQFLSILRLPDTVRAFDPDGELKLQHSSGNQWETKSGHTDAAIETLVLYDALKVSIKGGDGISRIQLRWHGDLSAIKLFLGDHWERSYADLEWRGEAPNRTMPWYFMAFDGKRNHGYGVKTGTGSLCFWNADAQGISLWLDVRSGGKPVQLGERTLVAAEIVQRQGQEHESPQAATHDFCRQMCPHPRLSEHPIYGTNDWNYAYGNNSADLIASVSGLISELSDNQENRPYSVIDEGWAMGPYNKNFGHGPWVGNPKFGDMAAFAERLKGLGVRPGIWWRALTPLPETPQSWRSQRDAQLLDPTIPEVQEHVTSHVKRLVGWGYEMIKHDYSSWDVLGQWGSEMGPNPTGDGWTFHDPTKTTAEVFTDLFRTIRSAAGEARLIGCNTMSHLAAGFHEVQRTGDDTSGRNWDRNRRMGVNTLAFRAPQHGAFYACDPDIVSITKAVSWDLVEQWLRLVSESGTTLFVAVEPSVVEPKHRTALRRALDLASKSRPVAEALDWMDSQTPRSWKLNGKIQEFQWMNSEGPWPFGD